MSTTAPTNRCNGIAGVVVIEHTNKKHVFLCQIIEVNKFYCPVHLSLIYGQIPVLCFSFSEGTMKEENFCWKKKELKARKKSSSLGLWGREDLYIMYTQEIQFNWDTTGESGEQKILISHEMTHDSHQRAKYTRVIQGQCVGSARQQCGLWFLCWSRQLVVLSLFTACANMESNNATAATRCSQVLKFQTQNLLQNLC